MPCGSLCAFRMLDLPPLTAFGFSGFLLRPIFATIFHVPQECPRCSGFNLGQALCTICSSPSCFAVKMGVVATVLQWIHRTPLARGNPWIFEGHTNEPTVLRDFRAWPRTRSHTEPQPFAGPRPHTGSRSHTGPQPHTGPRHLTRSTHRIVTHVPLPHTVHNPPIFRFGGRFEVGVF